MELKIGDKVFLNPYEEEDRVKYLTLENRIGGFCEPLNKKLEMIGTQVIIDDVTPNFISWTHGRWLRNAVSKVSDVLPQDIIKSIEANRPKTPEPDTMHPIDRAFYEDRIAAMRTATDTMGPNGGPKLKPILPKAKKCTLIASDIRGMESQNTQEARKYAGM